MNLHVGIAGDPAGWDDVLRQEGIPFELISDEAESTSCAVLIVGAVASEQMPGIVNTHLRSGGSLLCTAAVFARLSGSGISNRYVRYLIPDAVFPGDAPIDVEMNLQIPAGANLLPASGGGSTVLLTRIAGGDVLVLPFDPAMVGRDERTAVRTFVAQHRRLPFERVATVWRSGLRRVIARSVELLTHRRSLPFLRLWYFPNDEEALFCFRVDTDGALPGDVERVQSAAVNPAIPVSWFLDMQTQERHLGVYQGSEADEYALHCYRHQRYESFDDATRDIQDGLSALTRLGRKVHGFASPFGAWNQGIGRAIAAAGFTYSSEFSYDYDGRPSRPPGEPAGTGVLQIPVHPISIGGLRRQGFRAQEMAAYFERVIASALARRDPVILYHHPRDGYESVLSEIFERIRSRRIPCMTMQALSIWCQRREQMHFRITYHAERCRIQAPEFPEDMTLHVTRADGSEGFVPIDAEVDCSRIAWRAAPIPGRLDPGYRRARRFNPWIAIIRAEDFIYKRLRPRIWGT